MVSKTDRKRLLIIGNGMAAGKLLEELISKNKDLFDITVIGNEPSGNYNRIKLILKLKNDDVPDFMLNTPEWYEKNAIHLIVPAEATSIKRDEKKVSLSDGRTFSYDLLVLAMGSSPLIPPMKGLDLKGVGVLRKLEDVKRLREELSGKTHVTVVGGGLLGIELAEVLHSLGKHVTISHLMKSLMETQLSEEAGLFLQNKLEQKGIEFVMSTYITELLGSTAGVEQAVFKDGRKIKTEMVLFSCGIRPNTALAAGCGLNFNKGIVVDASLKTNDPSIYAVGECIEHQGKIWGLVAPVYEQARILAAVLCGEKTTYTPSALPPTRLKSHIPVISMGQIDPLPEDEVCLYRDPHSLIYKRLIIRENTLKGANIIGDDINIDSIGMHYSGRLSLPPKRHELLFPGAASGETLLDASVWPDDVRVCDCHGVDAGKIRNAILSGHDTVNKIGLHTKAGTGCGNCKNKIRSLIIASLGELKEDVTEKYYVPGIPMTREVLSEFILKQELKSCSSVFKSIPESVDDSKTRMGLDFLLNFLWKGVYDVEEDSRCANDRYSGNIQKDGTFSVIPHMAGGLATPGELRAIAEVAEKFDARIKVTGADRIGLYAIQKKDLKEVWHLLQMESGHAFTKCFRACKACVGKEYCRFGLGDSLTLGQKMSDRYRGVAGPAKFKMGVSGCPRNCSEATIKDFGVVIVEGGYDLYVGGNGGSKVVPSKLLARVETEDEVIAFADRFYEYYRSLAKYGERSAFFVERLGIDAIRDALLHDSREKLKKLEDDFKAYLKNITDPWKKPGTLNNEKEAQEAEWVDCGPVSEYPPGQSKLIKLEHAEIAVFHGRDGRWFAVHGRCPHKQGPIVDSIYGNGRLACPLHSYSFDIVSGKCNSPEIGDLPVYELKRSNERVWVKL